MAFKPGPKQPTFEDLLVILNTSKYQTENNPLWQTVFELLTRSEKLKTDINNLIDINIENIAEADTQILALLTADFLTHSNESALLTNSRELLAGANLEFDDSVANERTVKTDEVAGFSILAKSDTGIGDLTVITAGADEVLRRSGSGNLEFGALPSGSIDLNEQTTTLTGTQNDFDFTAGVPGYLRCNNASALVISGIEINGAAPTEGQYLYIDNIGSSTVKVLNEDTGSIAANRIITPSDNGQIIGVDGRMLLIYDSTTSRWREQVIDPGAPIDIPYNAGDFTASGSMTWTVESGDVNINSYSQRGKLIQRSVLISNSTVGGTPSNQLNVAIRGGFTIAKRSNSSNHHAVDGVSNAAVYTVLIAGTTILSMRLALGGNWSTSTNTTELAMDAVIEVE